MTATKPPERLLLLFHPHPNPPTLSCHSKCRRRLMIAMSFFFVAATVFSLTIGLVMWGISLLSVVYLSVCDIYRGCLRREGSKKANRKKEFQTIQNTPHFILVLSLFCCMHTYDVAKIARWNRERHILISFFHSLQHCRSTTGSYTLLQCFFAGSFKVQQQHVPWRRNVHTRSEGKLYV